MAASAWKKVKAVLTATRPGAPRADVLVTGPAPVVPPHLDDGARVREKKRALLSGLVEAASRKGKL